MSLDLQDDLVSLAELVKAHKAEHELPAIDQEHPIAGFINGRDWVSITAVLLRTAVFERPGRDIVNEGRELIRQTEVLVYPEDLRWAPNAAYMRSSRGRHNARASKAKRPKGWRNRA